MTSEQLYPEPQKFEYESNQDAVGFYDYNSDGTVRQVRNDLVGELAGMVQFVQSHSVNPSGNEVHHLPRLASEREALLLLTPDPEADTPQSVSVTVLNNGNELTTIDMYHPNLLYDSDRDKVDERPNVVYSKRAWSVVLPWDLIRPGMSLKFIDNAGQEGELGEEQIDMAPPAELIINNIRIGLLTDPPEHEDQYMLIDPVRAGVDYFQTVPVSEMTVAKYQDVKLEKVIVSSGEIYEVASEVEGGVYSGDMREDVGKSTFSVGTNLANWGITSSGMSSQHQPQLTQTVIVHHAKGVYSNGEQLHGLSGGNGMLTLIRSVGNEFSHEIGHHYGLGHYPGRDGDNDFWTTHHHDSGWGYIGHRKRLRANLHWNDVELSDKEATGVPNFLDMYRFTRDAMSGGDNASSLSQFTHYTGYSTQTRIQPSLNRAVFAEDSPTGYRKWNEQTDNMEVYRPEIPDSPTIWFNSSDGFYLSPVKHGVEVFTLLGGYDPVERVGLLYPPARSNWGNVFDLPEPEITTEDLQCWLSVDYKGSKSQDIALAPNRLGSNANKIHIQIPVDDQPVQAQLNCGNDSESHVLSKVDFPQNYEPIAPPVVIGREAGYKALINIELNELEQAWLQVENGDNPCNEEGVQILCDTYNGDADLLAEPAQSRFKKYLDNRDAGERLNRWVNVYAEDLQNGNPSALDALGAFLTKIGMGTDWEQLTDFLNPQNESILHNLEI